MYIFYIHNITVKDKKDKFFIPPVSAARGGPLYEQIVNTVKGEICSGRIRPNQPLPSFRALAEQLLVSVITVKRAYQELESQGIIYRRQGLGTFVSPDGAARSRRVIQNNARKLLRQAINEARSSGMSDEEILDLADELILEEKEKESHE